jgi:uncharacterized protein YgiM (DUF1202 family)
MLRGRRFIKVIHLILSIALVIGMMMLKSTSTFTKEQFIFLQAGAVILFFLQILLTYSSIRVAAIGEKGDIKDDESVAIPPSGLKFALFLFILLPILADLQNQFVLASSTRLILGELASDQSKKGYAQYVTAAQISIRSGPALGDDVVGVLPNGTRVPVFDKKYGWVRIGQNRWISTKYLSTCQKW